MVAAETPVREGYRSGFVALIGKPNVGKSTLLNGLAGEKVAITSALPQTTRRRILGIRTTEACQVVFVDTPGLHSPKHALGRYMVATARSAIPKADIVVWVVDVSSPPDDEDRSIARLLARAHRPVLLAMNKSDLLAPERITSYTDRYLALIDPEDWTLTVATEGHNLDRLWAMIVQRLPEGPPLFPAEQVSDQSDRMLAAELIREAALRFLREEIPHGVQVAVEEWQVRRTGALYVAARVFVERESHKGIVIGARGAMLKRIGGAARREIERLTGRRVYLELFVSVRREWRKSASELKRLGFD